MSKNQTPDARPEPKHETKTETLDEVRCPECGSEADITHTKVIEGQPIPPKMAGECGACGYTDHPIVFHNEFKLDRMSEAERAEVERKAEKQAARMAEHEYTAQAISSRREP